MHSAATGRGNSLRCLTQCPSLEPLNEAYVLSTTPRPPAYSCFENCRRLLKKSHKCCGKAKPNQANMAKSRPQPVAECCCGAWRGGCTFHGCSKAPPLSAPWNWARAISWRWEGGSNPEKVPCNSRVCTVWICCHIQV